MHLDGAHVHLRPLEPADAGRLAEILVDPEVAPWWGVWDADRVQREIIDDDEETWLAVELDGAVIGLIGYEEVDDEYYRSVGIDVTLGPDHIGRGLGSDAVRTLARHMIEARGHHRVTIDPAAENARAIRCYERVGFRPVGVMRRYERLAHGGYRDALLMDLLAEDLTP